MSERFNQFLIQALVILIATLASACVRNPAPIEPVPPSPPPAADPVQPAPLSPPPAPEPPPQPPLVPDDEFEVRSLEDLNRDSPLEPVFFNYDSSSLEEEARAVLEKNAKIIEQNPDWIITVEGHCDERGTAEYNLSLGERRALIARDYLVEMGLAAIRLRTVSYGKEFPFDPASTEMAWSENRRAHFVITAR